MTRQNKHNTRTAWRGLNRKRRESGTTAVEFALLSPVFFTLALGIVETSMIMFTQNVLENAMFNAARVGKVGYVATGKTREQTILEEVNARAGSFIDTSKLMLASKSYDNFSTIAQPEPYVDSNRNGRYDQGENYTDLNKNGKFDADRGASGQGNAQDVVVYTITYPWKMYTPLISNIMADSSGTYDLSAKLVVKNEPY